jgi:hypothetical protein
MYAAANGISLSRPDERSLALDMGISRKPTITYNGKGIKKIIGMKPKATRNTIDTADTGIVNIAMKNIIET